MREGHKEVKTITSSALILFWFYFAAHFLEMMLSALLGFLSCLPTSLTRLPPFSLPSFKLQVSPKTLLLNTVINALRCPPPALTWPLVQLFELLAGSLNSSQMSCSLFQVCVCETKLAISLLPTHHLDRNRCLQPLSLSCSPLASAGFCLPLPSLSLSGSMRSLIIFCLDDLGVTCVLSFKYFSTAISPVLCHQNCISFF